MITQDTTPPLISEAMLVVVDVQKGFVSPHSERALPVIHDVLAAWQAAGGITVMTQFINSPDSPYVKIIGWSQLMPDDEEIEFDPSVAELSKNATAIVRKHKYSSLTMEAIELLGISGLTNICIVGLDTESCVLATALAAFEQDYVPWIITDAVASHAGQAEHDAGLLVAGRYIGSGQLITSAQLLPDRSKAQSA
jgi:nicotinamidase-related amidase